MTIVRKAAKYILAGFTKRENLYPYIIHMQEKGLLGKEYLKEIYIYIYKSTTVSSWEQFLRAVVSLHNFRGQHSPHWIFLIVL